MKIIPEDLKNKIRKLSAHYLNKGTLKNVFLFTGGIALFISGMVVYGIVITIREQPLAEILNEKGIVKMQEPWILVDRKSNKLYLYDDTLLIKTYRANFGRNLSKPKTRRGDLSTPVGEYKICSKDSVHKYYKMLHINYPNLADASDGLRKGLITQKEFDKLKFDFYYSECPSVETALGSDIGIQGIGEFNSIFKSLPFAYNWTNGSISISNEGIDELFTVIPKGTKVVIQ